MLIYLFRAAAYDCCETGHTEQCYLDDTGRMTKKQLLCRLIPCPLANLMSNFLPNLGGGGDKRHARTIGPSNRQLKADKIILNEEKMSPAFTDRR